MDLSKPTWKEILLPDYKHFGDIENFLEVYKMSGYPYFMWNNRIYTMTKQGHIIQLMYTIHDIQ